jgi:hypothetical protein
VQSLCARTSFIWPAVVPLFFADFYEFLEVPFFGLSKPFPAVGDYVIIGPRRPEETACFGLIFYGFSGIILLHNS